MVERDNDKDSRPERPGFSRRLFLAGGAAVTGGVIWGGTDAASAGATPQWEDHEPPKIPGGTGNTGNTGGHEHHKPSTTFEITTTSLPNGVPRESYSGGIAVSGGVAPLHWAITAEGLPPGLVLNAATGAITGTVRPRDHGHYIFTVTVTDSTLPTPKTVSKKFTIDIT